MGSALLCASCVGGPVSDLPHSSDPDSPVPAGPSDEGERPGGGGLDAGVSTRADAGVPCDISQLPDGGEGGAAPAPDAAL